jgi:hypothetical protein
MRGTFRAIAPNAFVRRAREKTERETEARGALAAAVVEVAIRLIFFVSFFFVGGSHERRDQNKLIQKRN